MPLGLKVGPFPSYVGEPQKKELLQHLGACKIKPIKKNNNKVSSYVIAIFNNEKKCENALVRLHQRELFGRRLIVKYHNASLNDARIEPHERENKDEDVEESAKLKRILQNYEAGIAAISSAFNLHYPINPNLRYSYPPPSPKVITNIAHSLVAVPKFYTQVLHLMNKMNLPCPFGALTAEPAICKEAKQFSRVFTGEIPSKEIPEEVPLKNTNKSESESESELESDNDSCNTQTTKQSIPLKRAKRLKTKVIKRPKLQQLKQTLKNSPNISREPKSSSSNISNVFDLKTDISTPKKLEVRVDSSSLRENEIQNQKFNESIIVSEEGFGKIYPIEQTGAGEDLQDDTIPERRPQKYITTKEIQDNKVDKSDWPILPVFKNYSPGVPSAKLYIKNLAKSVTEADLKYIFGKFVNWFIDEEYSKFSIRHMKEGRMKGQAFITYSSTENAKMALEEINGFILKDKPMVIVFGKVKSSDI